MHRNAAPRSADVVADTTIKCLRLDLKSFDTLRAAEQEITEKVVLNLARLLNERLRKANAKMEVLSHAWSASLPTTGAPLPVPDALPDGDRERADRTAVGAGAPVHAQHPG